MYMCIHNVQENERNDKNNKKKKKKKTIMGFEPSTFPCKKTLLSLVRNKLPMPSPVLPLCVSIAYAYKLVYINYVAQIRYR